MIPKIVHVIYGLKDNTFKFYEFLCLLSIHRIIKPRELYIHTGKELSGYWYNVIKDLTNVKILPIQQDSRMKSLRHYAHKSDYLRLCLLYKYGGIYIDIDSIICKSYDELLSHEIVLGIQENRGLCNAVILARPKNKFIKKWLDEYDNFDNSQWDYHSVILPFKLSKRFDKITILDSEAFYYPSWDNNLDEILGNSKNTICTGFSSHLWKGFCEKTLNKISPEFILTNNCTYSMIVNKICSLEELNYWKNGRNY
jgi:hypothetical protein